MKKLEHVRKNAGLSFCVAVILLAVLVGYPLSFGPVCWLVSQTNADAGWLPFFYRPIVSGLSFRETRLSSAINWYSKLGVAGGWRWAPDGIPLSDDNWVSVEWVWVPPPAPAAPKGI
jgi:hypothetical protein